MVRRLGGCLVFACLFLAGSAAARPEYAAAVGEELGICTPPCRLCHTGVPDSDNTAQPFVLNLFEFARRLPSRAVNASTLPELLELMETEACARSADPSCATDPCGFCNGDDSGRPDVKELRAGDDPNGSGSFACPEYGCGARVAPAREERSHEGALALVAFASALAILARKRLRAR